MTKDELFKVTLARLRDLPGLPEESLQDLMALNRLYFEDRERTAALIESERATSAGILAAFNRAVSAVQYERTNWKPEAR